MLMYVGGVYELAFKSLRRLEAGMGRLPKLLFFFFYIEAEFHGCF